MSDPRRETRHQLHKRRDMLLLVFCAVLSGVEDWVGREALAEQKEPGWRKCLERATGIPSHETLSDVFGRLQPGACAEALLRWVPVAVPSLAGEPGGREGKTLRGRRVGAPAVPLLSAYAAQARLVLAPQAVGDQTHEITAIPEGWSLLAVEDALVSIDAIGCQQTSARDLLEAGADEVLALTDNPRQLREDVRWGRETAVARGRLRPQETVEKAHGRLEIRRYGLRDAIDGLPQQPAWVGLPAVGRVESTRLGGDPTPTDSRSSLCSFPDWARVADGGRGHGGIENGQHGVLDVPVSEDASRARQDASAENRALVRRMALPGIRHHGPAKDSIRRRQRRASLNDDYRAQLSFGPQQP